MKVYNKPDLNAPRYRPSRLTLDNAEMYSKFIEKYPTYALLGKDQFKLIISAFHETIWNTVINYRDGVELPEQLGYLFIGSCPRVKKSNVDYKKSDDYATVLQHQNLASDSYTAKIFYTNYETKYRFRHNDMWGFSGIRDFKRGVAATYPTLYKQYIVVDNYMKISRMFRIERDRQINEEETALLLEEYDEFNLD